MLEPAPHTHYSVEIAKQICDRMAGGESLKGICEDENMPHRGTIYKWTCTHIAFRNALGIAREAHADMLADEVVYIADTVRDAQRARNMIEARKWFASVIRPKTYGPRVDLNITETINIDSARSAALERVQRLISDQLAHDEPQAIDFIEQSSAGPTDSLSDDPPDSVDGTPIDEGAG